MIEKRNSTEHYNTDIYCGKFPVNDILNVNPNAETSVNSKCENFKFILKKFRKSDIFSVVFKTCCITYNAGKHNRMTKSELVDFILLQFEDASTDIEDLTILLHLKYVQICNTRSVWTGMKIENAKNLWHSDTTAEKFSKILQKYMNKTKFTCKIASEKKDDAMWTAISFATESLKLDVSFLLTFSELPLVQYCNLKRKYKRPMYSALVETFHGTGVDLVDIKSRNIETTTHFGYKMCEPENDAKLPSVLQNYNKKRPYEEEEGLPANLIRENVRNEKMKKKYLEETFGCNVHPAFESLTYNVCTDFFGLTDPDKQISATCRVVFKGNNVLEGLHQLVQSGMAKYPLPKPFELAPNSVHNVFNYVQKKSES